MKLLLLSLVLSAAPPWVSTHSSRPAGVKDEASPCCMTMKKVESRAGRPCVASATASASAPKARVLTRVSETAEDGRSEPRTVTVTAVGDAPKKEKGEKGSKGEKEKGETAEKRQGSEQAFLGVSLGEPPEALKEQLDLDDHGVIVLNVVEDSPADQAGLEVHDVIVAFDGDRLTDESDATDKIRAHRPGDDVALKVLRKGKEKNLRVTLGSRAATEGKELEWKVQVTPKAELEERVRTHGKLLRKGPTGQWEVEDLGDLHELKELPKHIQMFVPKSGNRSTQVYVEDGKKKITTRLERDGEMVKVEQDDGGKITVTREKDGGQETTTTYSSEEELAEADAEAAEMLKQLDQSVTVHVDVDAPKGFDFKFDFDKEAMDKHLGEWRETMDESLREAMEDYQRAMEDFHKAMEEWQKNAPSGQRFKVPALPPQWFGKGGEDFKMLFGPGPMARPKHSFEVRDDGSISVRIRDGDSELVRTFESEKDLKQRSPELYEKYQKMMSESERE